MPTTVTSSQARDKFGELLRLASEDNEDVVVTVRQKPTAVFISYAEYEELDQLRKLKKRLEAVEKLRALRKRVQECVKSDNLTPEQAYAFAGFGNEAITTTLQSDRRLTEDAQ